MLNMRRRNFQPRRLYKTAKMMPDRLPETGSTGNTQQTQRKRDAGSSAETKGAK